jgi:beta-glucosidase
MNSKNQKRSAGLAALVLLSLGAVAWIQASSTIKEGKEKPGMMAQTPAYRDLNKNGKMDAYEDKSQPIERRVEDLLSQMNLEE